MVKRKSKSKKRISSLGIIMIIIASLTIPLTVWSLGHVDTNTIPEAKGRDKGSISLVVLESTDGLSHWGGKIKFDIISITPYPSVNVSCYQNNNLVYSSSLPYYTPNLWDSDGVFTLSSASWTYGAADCKGIIREQIRNKITTTASTSFYAER